MHMFCDVARRLLMACSPRQNTQSTYLVAAVCRVLPICKWNRCPFHALTSAVVGLVSCYFNNNCVCFDLTCIHRTCNVTAAEDTL